MGFRGSRVRIPPSRFVSESTIATSRVVLFCIFVVGAVWGAVSTPLTGKLDSVRCVRDRRIANFSRLAHHREQRVSILLLIAREQRLGVLPPTSRRDVLERMMLSLRCPLPPVRMPQAPDELRQLRFSRQRTATCRTDGDPSAVPVCARQQRPILKSHRVAGGIA